MINKLTMCPTKKKYYVNNSVIYKIEYNLSDENSTSKVLFDYDNEILFTDDNIKDAKKHIDYVELEVNPESDSAKTVTICYFFDEFVEVGDTIDENDYLKPNQNKKIMNEIPSTYIEKYVLLHKKELFDYITEKIKNNQDLNKEYIKNFFPSICLDNCKGKKIEINNDNYVINKCTFYSNNTKLNITLIKDSNIKEYIENNVKKYCEDIKNTLLDKYGGNWYD